MRHFAVGTTEHAAGIWGMDDLANDGYNFYVAPDWHHADKILGANRNDAFKTTNLFGSVSPVDLQTYVGGAKLASNDSIARPLKWGRFFKTQFRYDLRGTGLAALQISGRCIITAWFHR